VNTALGVVTPNRDDLANLFSCTRAPILDYVSKCTKGRIIGTGNRDEDNIIRYFSKRGDGAVDLSPIADLHKSEVRQMFAWLATNLHGGVMPESAQAILVAKPSADLWGGAEQYDEEELGLPYDLVEWVDEFVAKQDGGNFWSLNKDARESLLTFWTLESKCSLAEAGIIRKVSEIELYTKHKANPNIPVCPVRNLDAFEV
jgi:NAD+ synthetase